MTSRTKIILIFMLFTVPTAASFLTYYFAKPQATGNYGELLSPVVTLPEVKLAAIGDDKTALAAASTGLRGKWLLLTRDSGACASACEQKLYAMRQARLILGRDMDRVVRVVLQDDDAKPGEDLQKNYAGTLWSTSSAWLSSLPAKADDQTGGRGYIYAVDPLGNVFMRYPADADIKRLSKDLQRVLKASQIG